MSRDLGRRSITVLVAAIVTVGTVTVMHSATGAPLPREGSQAPVAAAHFTDMTMRTSLQLPDEPPRVRQVPAPSKRAPARAREPMTLQIPDLGIDGDVVRTGMDVSRSIIVPEDVHVTGWFDGSRRLGALRGSTVIVGHRDSATQGSGALHAIEELPVGTPITVQGRDGTPYAYTVQSVELIDKHDLPSQAPRVFTREGPARLVLITCGGAFDQSARSYLSNVVVVATPTRSSSTSRTH